MNILEINQNLIQTKECHALSDLIYSLSTLTTTELDLIDFNKIAVENPLCLSMFYLISGAADDNLGMTWYKINSLVPLMSYKNASYLSAYEKVYYILYDSNIYIRINKLNENKQLIFEHIIEPSLSITDLTSTFECKKLNNTWYTYLSQTQTVIDTPNTMLTFKYETYNIDDQTKLWSELPHIHLQVKDVSTFKEMLQRADLDKFMIGLEWLENWMYASMTVAEPMPDTEFEALCMLLDLDYIKEITQFKLLHSLNMLEVNQIADYVKHLGNSYEYVDDLPIFDYVQ